MNYPKSRLEALSDGIMAIVATLLILLIEVPEMENPTRADLVQWFSDCSHILWAYAVSFIIIGNYWWLHNLLFEQVRRIDHWFTLVNLIFLLVVAVLPFSTHLVIDLAFTEVESMAEIIYGINQILACLCLLLMRYYILRHDDLGSTDRAIPNIGRLINVNCLMYAIALLITIETSTFVLFIYLSIPLATVMLQRFWISKR